MSAPDIQRIRQAVLKHRGGWQNASDRDVLELWRTLPEVTRTQYLEATANVDPAQPQSASETQSGEAQAST